MFIPEAGDCCFSAVTLLSTQSRSRSRALPVGFYPSFQQPKPNKDPRNLICRIMYSSWWMCVSGLNLYDILESIVALSCWMEMNFVARFIWFGAPILNKNPEWVQMLAQKYVPSVVRLWTRKLLRHLVRWPRYDFFSSTFSSKFSVVQSCDFFNTLNLVDAHSM
jgi:hypothetical protein